ncbi:MAG: MASE3 domain-containing protein [Aquabacterium sp.]|uniref:MASE3 domain-containing protein n=1 Tax=Aquabacterium sp. TaxID=1872578 RepID=UPI002A35DAF0|nr:MASE3 domain-containing protein [Aquabacterium sp.]MDX9844418.1 MASE3 domain-containing protein [Aquabacterium sp.]
MTVPSPLPDTARSTSTRGPLRALLPPTLMALGVWWASQHGYLLGHMLAELISAVVAWTALAVATTSVQFTRNHFVVFIAVGIGWCAGLDLLHTLTFKGMNLLPVDSANPPTQFWVAARLLQAATLLLAPLMLRRMLPVLPLHLAFGSWTVLCALLIASGHFPTAYIDGQGLTPFKIYAEYLIIALMGVAAALFWRQRALMPAHLLHRLLAAAVVMMAAEFAFTRYVSVYANANLVGHLLKIYAYWFVYDALVQHTLQSPFDMLARTASRYDAVPDPTVIVANDGTIVQANQATATWLGQPTEALVGQSVHALLHAPHDASAACPVCQRMQQSRDGFLITQELPGQRIVEYHVTPLQGDGLHAAWVQVLRDVTERERLSRERESLVHDLNERVKELRGLHGVTNLLKDTHLDLPDKLAKLVDLLPPCFVLPHQVRACIDSSWGHFGSTLPSPRPRRHLQASIERNGVLVGHLHTWYPDELDAPLAYFLPEERDLLVSVAAQLNETLQRMQAAERVQRLTSLYEMLSATNREVTRRHTREDILAALLGVLRRHGAFPALFMALNDTAGPTLYLHHGLAPEQTETLGDLLPQAMGPFSAVQSDLRQRAVVTQSVPLPAPRPAGALLPPSPTDVWHHSLMNQGLSHQAFVALRCDGLLVGFVALYARGLSDFDAEQTRLLEDIANEVQATLERAASLARSASAEETAEQMARRFEQVFQATPVPMQLHRRSDLKILALNAAHQRWLGYALSDIRNEDHWFELVFPDPVERNHLQRHWHDNLARCQDGQAGTSPELTLHCKDGSVRIARGTFSLAGNDVIVAWTDLTDIRRSEQALRDSEQRFRSMVEQTISGIFVRRQSHFIYVNPRFAEILGYPPDELIGQDTLRFVVLDEGANSVAHLRARQAQVDDGTLPNDSTSVPVRRKDGRVIELGLHAKRIIWDDGLPATIVMAQDITDRKQADDQIAGYVQQLEAAMQGTLQAVSNMVEMRDPYTAGHERHVGLIAAAIAHELGWDEARCKDLELIGLVHDIGKIAVPSEILTKPTRLTQLEMELMKGHAQAGYEILKDVPFRTPVAEIIRQHHERLDGSGYPRGLQGDEILPEARVLAVADVLESMSSHRPYRPAVGLDAALAELESHQGQLYDPEVVAAAVRLIRERGYRLPQ